MAGQITIRRQPHYTDPRIIHHANKSACNGLSIYYDEARKSVDNLSQQILHRSPSTLTTLTRLSSRATKVLTIPQQPQPLPQQPRLADPTPLQV